ncbi:hypothetical protein C8R48DRAFT_767706 [Suillus tomentosus]|nr:hypothetical protein C8R48DRAFT_767706 [Suillus tomentosus]
MLEGPDLVSFCDIRKRSYTTTTQHRSITPPPARLPSSSPGTNSLSPWTTWTSNAERIVDHLSLSVAPSLSDFDPWVLNPEDTQDNIDARAEKLPDSVPLPWLMGKEYSSTFLLYHAVLKVAVGFMGGRLHKRFVSTACPDRFCGVNGLAPENCVAVFCTSSNVGAAIQHYHIPAKDLSPAPPRKKNQQVFVLDGEHRGNVFIVIKCNVKKNTVEVAFHLRLMLLFVLISMSGDENNPHSSEPSRKRSGSALHMGPRKKATSSNPLVLHGRHFGRTVFALCNYPALLTGGILRLEELQDSPIEDYPADVRREHRVFMELVESYPGLLERLTAGEEEDIIHVGELMGKGASGARGDDTKTLKSAVLEWLMPRGQPLIPPLSRNIKSDRGFNHEVTGALLCPAGLDWSNAETKQSLKSGETAVRGDQWPLFLYAGYVYDPDAPWQGLLRSDILICGFKHVFTSPSSVEKEPKATRSGNAYLHGMKQVGNFITIPLLIVPLDTVTDSENFYHSILDILEDPDESEEVADLMTWWTHRIFPNSSSSQRSTSKNSALAKIREKRAVLQALANTNAN